MEAVTVRCDSCGAPFLLEPKEAVREGLKCIYLECPACKRAFPIRAMDVDEPYGPQKSSEDGGTAESYARDKRLMVLRRKRSNEILRNHTVDWFLNRAEDNVD